MNKWTFFSTVSISFILIFGSFSLMAQAQGDLKEGVKGPAVELIDNKERQQVEVTVNEKPFASFSYADSLMKPILYPIYSEGGNFLTRGWPIAPRSGEHTDHPHQRGLWLNYENVNGYDFWNNSYAIDPAKRKKQYGSIVHKGIESIESGNGIGTLKTEESWDSPYGNQLMKENTTYHFKADDKVWIIDRITRLTALDSAVTFYDVKDGFLGLRFNRFLHLPSEKAETFIDAQGNETTVAPDAQDATGDYLSSEGITGEDVWSTRAKWMDLFGNIEGEEVSIVIFDHPLNIGYPTYWHARGYGLFAANPLGAHEFNGGEFALNYTLPKEKSVTFRYRVLISSGKHLTKEEIDAYASSFAELYYD